MVATHPDDEVRCAGGLIRAWAARGFKVGVLSVSDGAGEETGQAAANAGREELNRALRKLCPTHVAVTRLGLPAGKVALHLNRLRNSLLSLASGAVTLIAPHEHDGNPDRKAAGGVCLEFARSRQILLARYALTWESLTPAGEARRVRFPLSDDARRAKARAVECFKSQTHPREGLPPTRVAGALDRTYEVFLV